MRGEHFPCTWWLLEVQERSHPELVSELLDFHDHWWTPPEINHFRTHLSYRTVTLRKIMKLNSNEHCVKKLTQM